MLRYARLPNRVILVLVVILLSLVIIPSTLASAVDPKAAKGISISPPLKEIVISTGLIQATTDVVVTNNTDKELGSTVKVVDFKALDEFGGISLGEVGVPLSKYNLANWMSLPGGNNVALPKGQPATIQVNIDNRSDLAPGGHYGAVVVTASSPNSGDGNKVSFKQQLVSLIFLKKLGGEKYGLELNNIKVKAETDLPSLASLKFASTGNVHVVPRGYVLVTDPKGKTVAKGIINPESTLVMPGNSRQFETILQPVGSSSTQGSYKVTAYYRYDGKSQFASKSVTYVRSAWSPKLIIGLIITGVAALIIVVIIVSKRRKSHYQAK